MKLVKPSVAPAGLNFEIFKNYSISLFWESDVNPGDFVISKTDEEGSRELTFVENVNAQLITLTPGVYQFSVAKAENGKRVSNWSDSISVSIEKNEQTSEKTPEVSNSMLDTNFQLKVSQSKVTFNWIEKMDDTKYTIVIKGTNQKIICKNGADGRELYYLFSE